MNISIILVAAGSGTRFGGDIPKQFYPFMEHTVLYYAACAFDHLRAKTYAVVPIDYVEYTKKHYYFNNIIAGKSTRSESIYEALKLLDKKTDLVIIHDGVRPLVSRRLINSTIKYAIKHGAAIPAVKITDTVKEVFDQKISKTIPRENLYTVQTPQVFKRHIILKAYESEYLSIATDDADLVQLAGFDVFIVPGENTNIKITTPFDIKMAEIFFKTI